MMNKFEQLLANVALDAAVRSADVASYGGMHQMEEPKGLQELAKETFNK